jgi:hypothetical protein
VGLSVESFGGAMISYGAAEMLVEPERARCAQIVGLYPEMRESWPVTREVLVTKTRSGVKP